MSATPRKKEGSRGGEGAGQNIQVFVRFELHLQWKICTKQLILTTSLLPNYLMLLIEN